jgi:N utilization substance protein B
MQEGMINRRYLRVKGLQAIYAFESDNADMSVGEKNMITSINKIYDLYLYVLELTNEVVEKARRNIEQNKEKRLATDEDLNPNLKFVNNHIVQLLENNFVFRDEVEKKKINWSLESDNIKKLWRQIRESDEYIEYMEKPGQSFEEDQEFMIKIFKRYIASFEVIHDFFEDKSIYWTDDLALVILNVIKTFKNMTPEMGENSNFLLPLFKDRDDDLKFVKDLFNRTIVNKDSLSDRIRNNTTNWELERIAKLDVVLMRMALCELLYFPIIPVKVTFNEYIELAKDYSTPKSKVFINGVLDKLVAKLKKSGEISKTGRGLIE